MNDDNEEIDLSTETTKDDDACFQELFFPKKTSNRQKKKAFAMLMMAQEMLLKKELHEVFSLCMNQKEKFPEEAQNIFFKALRYLKQELNLGKRYCLAMRMDFKNKK